jgi:hypothetical protein
LNIFHVRDYNTVPKNDHPNKCTACQKLRILLQLIV